MDLNLQYLHKTSLTLKLQYKTYSTYTKQV